MAETPGKRPRRRFTRNGGGSTGVPATIAPPPQGAPPPDDDPHPVHQMLQAAPKAPANEYRPYRVVLTLALAEALIALGGNFRTPKEAKIVQYLSVMLSGRWWNQMEPICVDSQWNLIQGQHRLLAYIRYLQAGGIPVVWEIRLFCPPEYSMVMDAAMPRSSVQKIESLHFPQATMLSTVTTATWQIACQGSLGHLATDPDLMEMLLGSLSEPRPCVPFLQEAVNSIGRVRSAAHRTGYGYPSGLTTPSMGVGFALMLNDDAPRAHVFIDTMVATAKAGAGKVVHDGSTGGEAALAFLVTDEHGTAFDRSRHERKHRTLTALWMCWRDPTLTYKKLFDTFQKKKSERMPSILTQAQWDSVSPEISKLAMDLLS